MPECSEQGLTESCLTERGFCSVLSEGNRDQRGHSPAKEVVTNTVIKGGLPRVVMLSLKNKILQSKNFYISRSDQFSTWQLSKK